jgi:protein phosphatase
MKQPETVRPDMPRLQHDTLLRIIAVTEQGRVRLYNEDSFSCVSAAEREGANGGSILVVADGMGGYAAGATASTMVTSELPRAYYRGRSENIVDNLADAVATVNAQVYGAVERTAREPGMGSTLVVCVVSKQFLVTANVGDSRAYLFRSGEIRQLTIDHTLQPRAFDPIGFSTRRSFAHVLTQAIGPMRDIQPHIAVTHLKGGDVILLCSDGLTSMVGDQEIAVILSGHPIDIATARLVALANDRGGSDNITIVAASVDSLVESDQPVPGLEKTASGGQVSGASAVETAGWRPASHSLERTQPHSG